MKCNLSVCSFTWIRGENAEKWRCRRDGTSLVWSLTRNEEKMSECLRHHERQICGGKDRTSWANNLCLNCLEQQQFGILTALIEVVNLNADAAGKTTDSEHYMWEQSFCFLHISATMRGILYGRDCCKGFGFLPVFVWTISTGPFKLSVTCALHKKDIMPERPLWALLFLECQCKLESLSAKRGKREEHVAEATSSS